MSIHGYISGGEVKLDGPVGLPDGTRVVILPAGQPTVQAAASPGHRVRVPLVPSDKPGSVTLDNARIAELLDDSDSP